ncbi:type III ribulose-bisphosphate carboxylase [Methanosarcina sp. KYL-1]|uniref:type III ribulose-bisphosphate carboxylase n=1 Tax=Methanosarcina sp. KYL-1 TaxID=2602068 RepID=UPI002100CB89|nr:type III ribulose-bisphosphate carboxylase [Methanosarcina sp. KYL-1]MCQ1536478.1 type III ribulose-bisphosphate carboxylase [Methanosarcina sp. KYL-1]
MRRDYVDQGYSPKDTDMVCEFHIEPAAGVSFEEASTHMAGESSIDSWTEIATLSPELAAKLKPHVFYLDEEAKTVRVAYSEELFELGSVPQVLSAVAGNIFSMKIVDNLRLQDITFPKAMLKEFKGPNFGLPGVREIVDVQDRPLIGTIVKPKVGLTSEKHAEVAYNAFAGGCDLVKDDENLTDQKFNGFEKRAELTLKLAKKAETETGERKMYLCNITAPTCREMVRRLNVLKDLGASYAMIDIVPAGWTALQTLREEAEDAGLALHAHRCMHSAFTRNPRHGVSMLLVAKLCRLIGLDQLHIGTVVGKMHGEKSEVLALRDQCVLGSVPADPSQNVLAQDWGGLKPMFPVASGGLAPTMVPDLYSIFGKDVIMQFGGGIHAHPMGTAAGATACRQALEASLEGVSLEEYAKGRKELEAALEKWLKK